MNDGVSIKRRGPCGVAGEAGCEFAPAGPLPDRSRRSGPQHLSRCSHCGHGITLPAMADVAALYESRESQDFQPEVGGLERAIKAWFFARGARALLAQLPQRPARMLDFGCGSGLFTRCLGDALAPGEVTGADFHAAAPAELAGRAYLPMAGLAAAGLFDAVLASHVLEHDDDAAGLLARITAPVHAGGIVVIEVPNIDCLWARLIGPDWDAWYAPYHRSHFSRASLLGLMERGGLSVVSVHAVCVPTMGRTLANIFGARNSLAFVLIGAALHPLQWLGERLAGTPSALRVVARKT